MSCALVFAALASSAHVAAQSSAADLYTQGFWPNRLIATTADRLVEFELDGTKIRELTASSPAFKPAGAQFGPNGHLYVADEGNDVVVEFDQEGAQVSTIGGGGLLEDPKDIAFGPDGNLWVSSFTDDIVVQLTRSGTKVGDIGAGTTLDGPTGLSFAPNGHLFVVSSLTNSILEFAGSEVVDEIGVGSGLTNPTGILRRGDGTLLVASTGTDAIFQFNSLGGTESPIGAAGNIDAPQFLTVGPDGNAYVASKGNDKIVALAPDGSLATTFSDASLVGVTGVVISPFRFKSTIRGPFAVEDFALKTQTEGAVVSYAPGSGTAMIQVQDSPNKQVDLVSIFGVDALVFHGVEELSDKVTKRGFHGLQVPAGDTALARGTGSIAFTMDGKVNKSTGIYGVTKLGGQLHRSSGQGVYMATFTTSKSLQGPKDAQ